MATNSNDIALSFEKSEYYSLDEACEYLNRKNGINNITPRKLLKQIAFREINTYIHFRAKASDIFYFEVDSYDSNIFYNNEILKKRKFANDTEYYRYLIEISNKIHRLVSNKITDDLFMGFTFFKVYNQALHNLALSPNPVNPTHSLLFDGLLEIGDLNRNPASPKLLEDATYIDEGIKFKFYDISTISLKIDSINDDELERLANSLPYKTTFDKRDKFSFIELYININDLIIIHKDLEQLEKQILQNTPILKKELSKTSVIHSILGSKGKSPQKAQAQLIANAHAQHLWAKDHEEKIRIGEMCNLVWAYMIETTYKDELPNEAKSLKDWLHNIPPYASIGGRPSEQ